MQEIEQHGTVFVAIISSSLRATAHNAGQRSPAVQFRDCCWRKPEGEVFRKSVSVALDLFVQAFGRRSIQICVQDEPVRGGSFGAG